jgi:hypothetical protein
MSKSVGLLLILALALGLWINFNPEARQRATQSWESAKALFVSVKAGVSVAVHDWVAGLQSGEQSNGGGIGEVWKQITSVLASWWDSAQRFWQHLTAGMGAKGL